MAVGSGLPKDIWSVIISHIDCGSDYKAVCLIDKSRLGIARKTHPTADTKFANQIMTVITMINRGDFLPRKFATKKEFFDFACQNGLSYNPNITMDYVIANSNRPWDWEERSRNSNITMNYILDNSDRPWDWYWVSHNPNITMDHILANPDRPWNW